MGVPNSEPLQVRLVVFFIRSVIWLTNLYQITLQLLVRLLLVPAIVRVGGGGFGQNTADSEFEATNHCEPEGTLYPPSEQEFESLRGRSSKTSK